MFWLRMVIWALMMLMGGMFLAISFCASAKVTCYALCAYGVFVIVIGAGCGFQLIVNESRERMYIMFKSLEGILRIKWVL